LVIVQPEIVPPRTRRQGRQPFHAGVGDELHVAVGEDEKKSECRNPKQIQNPKSQTETLAVWDFRIWDLELASDFGFRDSDFLSPGGACPDERAPLTFARSWTASPRIVSLN